MVDALEMFTQIALIGVSYNIAGAISMRIILVDPSRIVLKLMNNMLVEGGHEVRSFVDGTAALKELRDNAAIDVLMTSFEIPNISGLELCWEARLIANARRPIYIIAMSSTDDRDRLVEALDSGADDFITKPPVAAELFARLRAAERMTHAQTELIRLATIDTLTELPNRRAFFERAEEACKIAEASLAMIMFDIDHFKRVNDTWGHDVGDLVLKKVASVVKRCPGYPARIGGEEFSVLLESYDLSNAYHAAEYLRIAIERMSIQLPSSTILGVTISLGVAEHTSGQSVDQLLKNADVALYAAKTGGRNRTVSAQASNASSSCSIDSPIHERFYLEC